ncbi:hypothetical protein CLV35_3288 [Motilibacter peucedani]|uniref:Secreted protein with PEP-CTERM sorting signal n=1 Tax=Motilibacter peucedani TaxID=598650 RepID=A0A420XM58_9ACTN|nr:hypothetical protein [Motilibacter peucedani]RKS71489.1 hypothetical protein CLV35_3288 [Motilibacter peucedani]
MSTSATKSALPCCYAAATSVAVFSGSASASLAGTGLLAYVVGRAAYRARRHPGQRS